MKKFCFLLVTAAILGNLSPASAQYVLPPRGVWVNPAHGFGYWSPGYRWREQRLYQDPRRYNNFVVDTEPHQTIDTSRIGVTNPTRNYPGECAAGSSEETCRAREQPNYAGECAIGASEETCRARGQAYNPPRHN